MRLSHLIQGEADFIDHRRESTGLRNPGQVTQDLAMLLSLKVMQHRDQHEHHVQGQSLEVCEGQIQFAQRDRRGDLPVQCRCLE